MDDSDLFAAPYRLPMPSRPLSGLTILVVEDSLYASDAVRLLCLRSGARIRRADCLASARRHLQVYRPSVVIVDLGLPDGSGLDMIEELNAAVPRVGAILATSGDDSAAGASISAGADGFLEKPVRSLAVFQSAVLSALSTTADGPTGPVAMTDEDVHPDPLAFQDDMAHAVEVLSDQASDKELDYVTHFVAGLARIANDEALAAATARLMDARAAGAPIATFAARVAGMAQERARKQIPIGGR